MASKCSNPVPSGCSPSGLSPRLQECFDRRFNAATNQASLPAVTHTTNGDESRYADQCGTYTKCLPQDSPGKVNIAAYTAFRNAINLGETDPAAAYAAFEALALGGARTQNGPMGSFAYCFLGADSSQFGDNVVAPAPALASKAYATELIELYWASLLRDVHFTDYTTNPIALDAANELSNVDDYSGPVDSMGNVTPALLFRGGFQGEAIGPYLSQFLLIPSRLGALPFSQRYITYLPGYDYMTNTTDWFAVQQGQGTSAVFHEDSTPRFLHNGRGLASYTHVDELYQAYFTAHLVLEQLAPASKILNPGNPYVNSAKENGFGTFGFPDVASVLSQVAKVALNAVWYQKWVVHLRHRPEAGGGLIHYVNHGSMFDGKPDESVFKSEAVKRSHDKYGTYLLSQAFPEGSPSHPAYPTGHGCVGGACITLLKFFYNGDFVMTNPLVSNADGTSTLPWDLNPATGGPGNLTVNGELNKLARNITLGHGIHGGIHWRTDSESSMLLGEAVALNFLQDLACTYAEPFTVNITTLQGATVTISN